MFCVVLILFEIMPDFGVYFMFNFFFADKRLYVLGYLEYLGRKLQSFP